MRPNFLKEGFYETSISRSYYSMFYLAQAVLATKDIYRKKHSGVSAAFAEHFTNKGLLPKMLHIKILRAFEDRRMADYDMEISKTEKDASQVLGYAKDFREEVAPFLTKWMQENEK